MGYKLNSSRKCSPVAAKAWQAPVMIPVISENDVSEQSDALSLVIIYYHLFSFAIISI